MEYKKSPIFDCLGAVSKKIPTYKYNKKDVSAFILLMWLSHNESCMPYVDKINERLFDMPQEAVFSAMFKGLPKGNIFFKWDKKTKDKDKNLSKKKEDIIVKLVEEYGFSDFEARTLFKRYIDV
jgi:hypothetical protein